MVIALILPTDTVTGSVEEARLISEIFKNYNRRARPVKNVTGVVQLRFDLALKQILDVDERNQIISTNVWVRQYWTDEFIRWNSSLYDGVKAIRVDAESIWKPDLRLYNTAQENFKGIDIESKTKATIFSDGSVVWLSPHILKSVCKMDVTYFPFDDQYCKMVFASWAYHGAHVNVTQTGTAGDLANYSPSGELQLLSFKVTRNVKKYNCCLEPYPELTYTLHLRRRARFFLMNTIVPSTLISFLAFLSFSLPPDSGERIGLVITTLLSLAVFMMIISDQIPPTSEVFPLLQKFLTAVMFEIGIALMANCIVISWASRDEPPSKLIKKIFGFEFFKSLLRKQNKAKITSSNGFDNKAITDSKESHDSSANSQIRMKAKPARDSSWESKILRNLEIISESKAMKRRQEEYKTQWRLAGATLDRLCIVLFLITIVATLGFVFNTAPQITL